MIREFLAVAAGGALGSAARHLLAGRLLAGATLLCFPLGTFTVNALGSLFIGLLLGALRSQTAAWLLVTGFCGGFTTFSTFSADTVRMLRAGSLAPAAAYVVLSMAVCMAGTAAGMYVGTTLKFR